MTGKSDQAGVKKPTTTDRVRLQLEQEIHSGHLKPGEHLDEMALSLRLGCSRTPVREALSQLVALGVLVRRSHCGVYVAVPKRESWHDIVEAYVEVEALCAAMAIPRMSSDDRRAAATAADDPMVLVSKIRAECGNQVMGGLAEHLKTRLDPMIHRYWDSLRNPGLVAADLAHAISSGDSNVALQIIRGPMRQMLQSVAGGQTTG